MGSLGLLLGSVLNALFIAVVGLVQQLVLAILAATTALSGVALVLADRGPRMTSEVPLVTFCGLVLLLFAFVLGSRVVVVAFRSTWHDAHPARDRRAP